MPALRESRLNGLTIDKHLGEVSRHYNLHVKCKKRQVKEGAFCPHIVFFESLHRHR